MDNKLHGHGAPDSSGGIAPKHAGGRKPWEKLLRLMAFGTLSVAALSIAGIVLASMYVMSLIPDTPNVDDLLDARTAQPSVLLSADGKQLAVFSRAQQAQIDLAQMSPYIIKALIATEDHRFYAHQGIDIKRTLAAVFHTAGGDAQGGSTITQQLARNLFPEEIGRSRTLDRKLKEIITAVKIEKTYTKRQILETYLNTVPFLYNIIGIEMAARSYFDKPAAALDALESATLVGMLKGTSYYNPIINPERAQKRRNVVLAQMVKREVLSDEEYQALREQPLHVELTRPQEVPSNAPHFTAHLRKWLINWADENDYNLYTDGLIIHSTIDDALQQAATQAVERQADALQNVADVEWGRRSASLLSHTPGAYARMRKQVEPFRYFWSEYPDLEQAFIRETPEYKKARSAGQSDAAALAGLQSNARFIARVRGNKTRLEAGFVAMDPATGEVKAWVGSRDFERDQFDHVSLAERQPGSTFKPIVYGAALEQGLRPNRTYLDNPVAIRSVDGSIWRPTDMSGASGRQMSMREGLIFSKNTITAQVMQDTGLPSIISLAHAVGINQSRLKPVPSLALGTSPVTLLEMVSAYSTIAQIGEYRQPVFVKRITDRSGKLLAEFGAESRRAMSRDSAVELIDMMRGVVNRGTGQMVKTQFGIVADIAGKTGTTQNNTDGWFILMHPNLVAGAWVGFNDSRVTMRSDYWGQGGHNAILLVGDFFRDTLKAKRIDVKAQFPKPRRAEPLMVQAPSDDWLNQLNANGGNGNDLPPPGYGVITRSDSNRVVIIGPQGVETVERSAMGSAAINAESIGRILTGNDRDPATGARAGVSSGSSGARGSADTSEPQPPLQPQAQLQFQPPPPPPQQPAPRNRNPAQLNSDKVFPESLRW